MTSDDFDFDILNFPFLDGDVPHRASYAVFTAKLLRQGYRYHNLGNAFSKFYRIHSELISKFNVCAFT